MQVLDQRVREEGAPPQRRPWSHCWSLRRGADASVLGLVLQNLTVSHRLPLRLQPAKQPQRQHLANEGFCTERWQQQETLLLCCRDESKALDSHYHHDKNSPGCRGQAVQPKAIRYKNCNSTCHTDKPTGDARKGDGLPVTRSMAVAVLRCGVIGAVGP